MLGVLSAVLFFVLAVTGTYADYSCLCSYAVEQHIYQDPDVSSTTIDTMYEFDCKPIYLGGSKAKAGWEVIVSNHQIGYTQKASTLQIQTCQGSPQFRDTVTTGPPTKSTTTHYTTTTSSTTTISTSTPTNTTSISPTTSFTPAITTSTPERTTTTAITMAITTAPTIPSVPAHMSLPHTASTKISRPTTTLVRPTTHLLITHTPTTKRPKLQTQVTSAPNIPPVHALTSPPHTATTKMSRPTTTTTTTATLVRPTTHLPMTHAPTTQRPRLQTTPAPQTRVTQPIVKTTTKAPRPAAHVTTTYTCPRNIKLGAIYNDGGTTVHGNICYELVTRLQTWQTAETSCNHKGGYLIHVASYDEETAIMRLLQSHRYYSSVWTGLNDIGHEQQFTWTNGDPVTYTKWLSYNPSWFHGIRDCVIVIPGGVWSDMVCSLVFASVCQYDAIPHTGSSYTTVSSFAQAFNGFLQHLIGK